jgi:hypothetical protein
MHSSVDPLVLNLGVASLMVGVTTLTHFFGLLLLTRLMSRAHTRLRTHEGAWRQAGMILLVVFGVFALHTMEIWAYALAFRSLGEFQTLEEALYFSTVTFSTLGYGDLTLSISWRVLGAIEAANGLILIAWSTAFLVGVTTRLRALEHDWLERDQR